MARESWRGLGREELDHQYSPSQWSHRLDKDAVIEEHVKEMTDGTRLSRTLARLELNIPYGESESEMFDLYLPKAPSTALQSGGHMFQFSMLLHERHIIGRRTSSYFLTLAFHLYSRRILAVPQVSYSQADGSQILEGKEESGFMVPPLVSHGIAVMVMDYDIAPKGNMDLIVSQVRRSIAATLTRYPQFTDIYLCGHSAGAHLAAMTLCADWSEYNASPNIRGAVLMSGIYDLVPIIHTYVNDALGMSQEEAERNSPIEHVADVTRNAGACRIGVVVAEHDSPEFHRQSKDYIQRLKAANISVCFKSIEAVDHFDVIERLSQEDYELTQLILEMITDKACN